MPVKPRLKTNSAHFKAFTKEVATCMEKWGLNDIGIYAHHGKRKARATFSGDNVKRIGTVTLSTHWEKGDKDNPVGQVTEEQLKQVARHECIHALLLPITSCIGGYCTQEQAEEAEERVVQRLLRILP